MPKSNNPDFMKGRPRQGCQGQGAFYDKLLVLGPLTDKKIEEYERQGKYGDERKVEALQRLSVKELDKRTTKEGKKRRQYLEHLLDDLI